VADEFRISLKPRWWWPLAGGVLVGIALRVIYSGQPGAAFETMSGSFALLAPIAVSAVSVYVAELQARRTWSYYFWMGALANALFAIGAFLVHLEGLICVLLATPMFAIIGGLAGLIVGAVFRGTRWMRRTMYCCALAPLLLGAFEHHVPLPQTIHTLERTIIVAATPADIWDQLMTAPAIRPGEVDDGLIYRIGVPLPESAFTGQTDSGELLRHIRMGKGIQFDQVATDWQVCRRVRWLNRFTPDSFPPRALDDHVRVGGHYFDVTDTEYSLHPRADGTTALRVAISYRVSTRFNWYAGRVAALLIGNFEETVLRFYARRAEALAARERAARIAPQSARRI
jgi:hypothetical protein